jgi:hypothetical protein
VRDANPSRQGRGTRSELAYATLTGPTLRANLPPRRGGATIPYYIYIYKGIVRSYEKRQKYINCYYVFIRVDGLRECSSVGRASHLHCEGRGFETCHFHNYWIEICRVGERNLYIIYKFLRFYRNLDLMGKILNTKSSISYLEFSLRSVSGGRLPPPTGEGGARNSVRRYRRVPPPYYI